MEEILKTLLELGFELDVVDFVFLWLAWKVNAGVLIPLRLFLRVYTEQLKSGSLGHNGIAQALKDLKPVP